MRIKRFVATDMRSALHMVRDDQGPHAVILSSRKLETGQIEVVAATDYDEALVQQALRAEAPAATREAPAPAPIERDCVVHVTPVSRAAAPHDELTVVELAEVVRDEVLRFVDQLGELADGAVAPHQLAEQAPPQRVGQEADRLRQLVIDGHRLRSHRATVPRLGECIKPN